MSIDRNSAPSFVTDFDYPCSFHIDSPKYFSDDFTMYLVFKQDHETYRLSLYQIDQQGTYSGVMKAVDRTSQVYLPTWEQIRKENDLPLI